MSHAVPPASPASLLERRGRLLLALVSLGLAAAVAATWERDELDRRRLLERAQSGGLPAKRQESLRLQLDREADSGARRLSAARVMFAARGELQGAPPETVSERLRKLEAVEELAAEALTLLPGSWEAAMLLGTARFEQLLVARDTRLFSAAARWELPMSVATARASGGRMASQNLAAAYLEVYPALASERRRLIAPLLRDSLAAASFRGRQIERWLEVAGSLQRAEELLPDDSESLAALAYRAWRVGETEAALVYWTRQHARLRDELTRALDAPGRSAGAALARVVTRAAVDRQSAPIVQRALARLPARNAEASQLAEAALGWLDWARPLCLLATCPLASASFEKLAALAAPRARVETLAFAALAAGDRSRAERLAQSAGTLATESWADYLLLAAKRQLERSEPGAAAALLARAHPHAGSRPLWVALQGQAGRQVAAESAALLRRESWGPADWRRVAEWSTLELGVGRRSRGLTLELAEAARGDVAFQVEWDGAWHAPIAVRSGRSSLELRVDIAPGLHLLRLRTRAGSPPALGTTTLD